MCLVRNVSRAAHRHNLNFRGFGKRACVGTVSANELRIRGIAMSDELDWNFVDRDDAKAEIRAAVAYLMRGATGGIRGDIVQGIIAIVRDVANEQPPGRPDALDDDMPGG